MNKDYSCIVPIGLYCKHFADKYFPDVAMNFDGKKESKYFSLHDELKRSLEEAFFTGMKVGIDITAGHIFKDRGALDDEDFKNVCGFVEAKERESWEPIKESVIIQMKETPDLEGKNKDEEHFKRASELDDDTHNFFDEMEKTFKSIHAEYHKDKDDDPDVAFDKWIEDQLALLDEMIEDIERRNRSFKYTPKPTSEELRIRLKRRGL